MSKRLDVTALAVGVLTGIVTYSVVALILNGIYHLLFPRYSGARSVVWFYGLLRAANIGLTISVTFVTYRKLLNRRERRRDPSA